MATTSPTGLQYEKLPVKLLLQVREGVPNLLFEFEVEVESGTSPSPIKPGEPGYAAGARLTHSISSADLITGMARALHHQAQEMLHHNMSWSDTDRAAVRSWLKSLMDRAGDLEDE